MAIPAATPTTLLTTPTINPPSARFHYMDNLRALAMMLGVIFHIAMAYSPLMHGVWFTSDAQSSQAIDVVIYFLHLFRMPIFFLIAGFFALLLLEKRGLKPFLKHRAMRIFLPFILFFPLTALAFMQLLSWAAANIDNVSPLIEFFVKAAKNPDGPKAAPSTMHLWFLPNLFGFCLCVAALYKVKFFQSAVMSKLISSRFILFVLPLLMVPALMTQGIPHPAPDKLYPQLWSFGFYGLFFLLGCFIYLKQDLLLELASHKHKLLLVALLAYAYFYTQLPAAITLDDVIHPPKGGIRFDLQHLLTAIAETVVAVYMTIYCLLTGKQLLNKQNRVLRFIADSSYWVYIIHIPVLLYIQFMLLNLDLNMWLKFIIGIVGTLGFGMITYVLLVRPTPLGTLLNGKRTAVDEVSPRQFA